MFFWGIFTSIFWALVIAVVLWILCAFSGRLVNPNYRMPLLLHLLCFAVAVLSIIFLTIVFTCNKINHAVTEVDTGIAKLMMADGKFVNGLRQEINQTSSTKDNDELTVYVAKKISEKISSDYSFVGKYVDVNQILKKTDFGKQTSQLTQGDISDEKTQEILQVAAGEFTKGIRMKINSVRLTMWIFIIALQSIAFGTVFYMAINYRKPTNSAHYRKRNINRKHHYRNHYK